MNGELLALPEPAANGSDFPPNYRRNLKAG